MGHHLEDGLAIATSHSVILLGTTTYNGKRAHQLNKIIIATSKLCVLQQQFGTKERDCGCGKGIDDIVAIRLYH